jgi:hypothetical protein
MTTVFLRVLEAEDKAAALCEAIRHPVAAQGQRRFEVDPMSFTKVPRSPFAYWVSDRLRRLFTELLPFDSDGRTAKQGLATADDFRFVRAWWAMPQATVGERWFPFAKGGKFLPFYADVYLVVNWGQDGAEIKTYIIQRYPYLNGNPAYVAKNTDFYFRPGLTWPLRTNGFSMRAMPAGCIFGHKGPAAFVESDYSQALLALAAITNSSTFGFLVSLQLARTELAQSYEIGLIQNTPVPELSSVSQATLATLARRAWSLKRMLDTRTETSHAFTLPALLQVEGTILADRAVTWAERSRVIEVKIAAIQDEIDARCFDLYKIDEGDRHTIIKGFCTSDEDGAAEPDEVDDADNEDEKSVTSAADAASLTAELVLWTVGVAFGRFDVRLATGARALPSEPEPFDALPVCSPAMLTGDDGLPLAGAPLGYPLTFPADGVLVDDPGHSRDLTAAVYAVFDIVFGNQADDIWHEAAALLDPQGSDLRTWLAKSFFGHHLKRYSKSRRKAPLLWQLATASCQYAIWLYAHRLTRDSFFQVLNDFIGPKLTHEERRFTALTQEVGQNPAASQRKEIAEQEAFVVELRTMRDEVARIAPLWNPDLNDGVVLTMAPLWRLVPQHRVWQKELKTAWDALCAGNYDWAHVAMHLWPERVVPKCAEDRSLAIAHGLEEVLWERESPVTGRQSPKGESPVAGQQSPAGERAAVVGRQSPAGERWVSKQVPREVIEKLIAERTSPAVKEARKSLLEAPALVGGRRSPVAGHQRQGGTRRRRQEAVENA